MRLTKREMRGSLVIVAISAVAICIAVICGHTGEAVEAPEAEVAVPVVVAVPDTGAVATPKKRSRTPRRPKAQTPPKPRAQGLDNVISDIPL